MAAFFDLDTLQTLLDVEIALAEACADVGLVSAASAAAIRASARVERFDMASLREAAIPAGNLAIPFVRRLTEVVAAHSPDAAAAVHRGATSQDVLDTALVLQLRRQGAAIHNQLSRAMAAAAADARRHRATVMPGRTWLQQATPVTLGLKIAGWIDAIGRCRERLAETCDRAMVVQLGGASGTLAALGDRGPAVIDAFARRLSLRVPESPWHTQRDRVADVACALGLVCGTLGKLGRDLTLLAQTEVGEVAETPSAGAGGSSAMPHKQNPVRAVRAIAASIRAPGLVATLLAAMPQEHERAAGGWQAEWDTLPALVDLTRDAAEATADALSSLTVDATRMRQNVAMHGGVALSEALSAALVDRLGRTQAMAVAERLSRAAVREGRALADVAAEDSDITLHVPAAEIRALLDPDRYLGAATVFVDRVLHHWNV